MNRDSPSSSRNRSIRERTATRIGAVCLLATALIPSVGSGCSRPAGLVVYTSQDQVYAQPILDEFSRKTGMRVTPLFDSEAVKTVGLANRLLAERANPRCDVFWSNEELRTRQLQARGVLADGDDWRRFGHRSRRIVINTNLVDRSEAPTSLVALTNEIFRGRIALAYPLFGTTATHFMALRQAWGPEPWLVWCRALMRNQPLIVDGNSVVVRLVGKGEVGIGLTDSDDIAAGQRNGLPIAQLPVTADMMRIPNTAALVRGAPHPEFGRKLLDHLSSADTVRALTARDALESPVDSEIETETIQPDWDQLIDEIPAATKALKAVFLRSN